MLGARAQIRLWVKPARGADSLAWDPWRSCWVVSCRAPASGGKANQAVKTLMAEWLGLPTASVRWDRSGTSRAKVLAVEGITEEEAAERLRSHLVPNKH